MFILHSESRLAVALLSGPAKCVAAELTLYHSGVFREGDSTKYLNEFLEKIYG